MNPKDWGVSARTLLESCEYCDSHNKRTLMPIESSGRNVEMHIKKKTRVLYYDDGYGWQEEYFEFNYCPMCGRKLEG